MYIYVYPYIHACLVFSHHLQVLKNLWAQEEARAKERGRVLAPAVVEVAVFGAPCRPRRAMKNEGPGETGSFVFKTCCWGPVHNLRNARRTRQKDSRMGSVRFVLISWV